MNLTVNETNHPVVNLVLAPIWGLAFLMFLPLIGFVLTAQALLKPVFNGLPRHLGSPATGAAYLTGSEGTDRPHAHGDQGLSDVADEVALKRSERS